MKRDIEKLEQTNRVLNAQLSQTKQALDETTEQRNTFRDSVEDLQKRNQESHAALTTASAELKATQEQMVATKKRFDVLEGTIKVLL